MHSVILAASLLALTASAQRLTTTDATGETIVISISTNAVGGETTRTLSTILDTLTSSSSSSSLRGGAIAVTPTITSSSSSRSTTTATTTTKTTNKNKGVQGAPTTETGEPMTATTYWYPDPADPTGNDWLSAVWENSWVPVTKGATVAAGTIATAYTASAEAANAAAAATGGSTSGAHRAAAPGALAAILGAGAGALLLRL